MKRLNRYDLALQLFTSDDSLRTQLIVPNKVGDYTYASNGYILIKIKNDLLGGEYSNSEKTPDYEAVIPTEFEKLGVINVDKYLDEVMRITKGFRCVADETACEKCEGTGYYICECCGNEVDCKCQDVEKIEDEAFLDVIRATDENINIKGVKLSGYRLQTILYALLALQIEKINVGIQGGLCLFYNDDILILVMAKS